MQIEKSSTKSAATQRVAKLLIIAGIVLAVTFHFARRNNVWFGASDTPFLELSTAGISYTVPPDWQVFDPPTEQDLKAQGDRSRRIGSGFTLIYVEKFPLAMFFEPNGGILLIATQEPRPPNPGGQSPSSLQHLATDGYFNWKKTWFTESYNPLLRELIHDKVQLADGSELDYYQSRSLPGILAGDDTTHAMAYGMVNGRYLMVSAAALTKDWHGGAIRELINSIRISP